MKTCRLVKPKGLIIQIGRWIYTKLLLIQVQGLWELRRKGDLFWMLELETISQEKMRVGLGFRQRFNTKNIDNGIGKLETASQWQESEWCVWGKGVFLVWGYRKTYDQRI